MTSLSQIPGYDGYQASRQRNQQQELGQLQQFSTLQTILANVEKAKKDAAQQQMMAGLTPAQLKDPEVWTRLAVAQNKPEYQTHAERLRKEQQDQATLETMRGAKTVVVPDPQEVAQAADQGTVAPKAVTSRTGGIFDGLAASQHPQIAQQAQTLRASMERAGNSVAPQYWQNAQTALAARESSMTKDRIRTYQSGELNITEELQPDGSYRELARGPKFAKQVAPAQSLHSEGTLTPESIRDLAIQSLYDPNALAGYRRDPKAMSQIANERIKVMRESGVTSEDVVSGRAGFRADNDSLRKITPQYDAITAFEKTAIRNGKILMDLADRADATGVPVLERWIRAGRKEVAGDTDVAQFNAQMNLYRAEAARILTQPNLSGVLTDTARKEMEHVLGNNASAQQVRSVVNLLERDFNNRKETLEEQITAIRARMRGRVAPGGGGAPGAPMSIEDRLKKYK